MISVEETLSLFNYSPLKLTSGSNRRVIAYCPKCNIRRETTFRQISPSWTCPDCARKKGNVKNTKYSKNESFFSTPNPLNSYWAGFIAADGSINPKTNIISILVKRTDREHLEKFCQSSGFTGRIIDGSRKATDKMKETHYSDLRIYAAQNWIKDLEKNFNITPNKTFTLQPPVGLNEECEKAFLVGLIDGDGCIYKSSTQEYIQFLGTESVTNWVKSKFDIYCYFEENMKIPQVKSVGKCFDYRVAGKNCSLIVRGLSELNLPRLERKWNKII